MAYTSKQCGIDFRKVQDNIKRAHTYEPNPMECSTQGSNTGCVFKVLVVVFLVRCFCIYVASILHLFCKETLMQSVALRMFDAFLRICWIEGFIKRVFAFNDFGDV